MILVDSENSGGKKGFGCTPKAAESSSFFCENLPSLRRSVPHAQGGNLENEQGR